ncbi:unnamed protein product [Adineta steineri]|uniref:Microtubule-associated protein Jupiter n=2 Tax=Adineta steineri TaxID=433720 RepID=A0A815K4H0_9BILA|nr:unnamed protein product [Adineta steineri]CAF1388424.1 unnamed protein product [Adineta steineri]
MSNMSKEHTSIRVHAPPGGHSNNIFSTSEAEQSANNKKNNMASDIFGSNKDTNEPTNVTKQSRNTGNNIFGTDTNTEQAHVRGGTLAGQYKQTQMKSNIFGTDEPTSARTVSDKNKSNIFGIGDNENTKQQQQGGNRHGLRVGYNPINGEAYAPKETAVNTTNEKEQPDSTVKPSEPENTNVVPTESNENVPVTSSDNGQTTTPAAETSDVKASVEKTENATNGNNAQKNVHTSVRVFHPPGGKSNGPLW